jgi:hypothetical protein
MGNLELVSGNSVDLTVGVVGNVTVIPLANVPSRICDSASYVIARSEASTLVAGGFASLSMHSLGLCVIDHGDRKATRRILDGIDAGWQRDTSLRSVLRVLHDGLARKIDDEPFRLVDILDPALSV